MSTFLFLTPVALLLTGPADAMSQSPDAGIEAPPAAVQPSPRGTDETKLEQGALQAAELDAQRGGESVVVGNQTLTAITTGNVLNGDYTAGSVTLSDSAFANFNGLGNLAINTGAQVSLQSGMNVTINIAP